MPGPLLLPALTAAAPAVVPVLVPTAAGPMQEINDAIASLAGTAWVLPVLFLLCVCDGFFPPLPSESVVVALTAIAVSTGSPALAGIVVAAAAGAIIGDNIAWLIGRSVGVTRFRWMRRRRVQQAFRWARGELDRRGALLILTARYIPVGRVAVNMTAGATGFTRPRFVLLTVIAGISWAGYSVVIGVLAGAWARDNHVLAAGVAIAIAVTVGIVVDRLTHRLARRDHAPEPHEYDRGRRRATGDDAG
ncbi:membrane protein [Tersicoccus solisilvae]|uniref:Membrane protein n=1 Tax=Tersicoccus solisilvae TaxID=1882339 RepID=A0ABQ1P923_9MICC|nr:VTT domain-containing protein [Tersicoccus solisilvae]GGC93004.1 membrane protein [Tersicoccus solisilvae]